MASVATIKVRLEGWIWKVKYNWQVVILGSDGWGQLWDLKGGPPNFCGDEVVSPKLEQGMERPRWSWRRKTVTRYVQFQGEYEELSG